MVYIYKFKTLIILFHLICRIQRPVQLPWYRHCISCRLGLEPKLLCCCDRVWIRGWRSLSCKLNAERLWRVDPDATVMGRSMETWLRLHIASSIFYQARIRLWQNDHCKQRDTCRVATRCHVPFGGQLLELIKSTCILYSATDQGTVDLFVLWVQDP